MSEGFEIWGDRITKDSVGVATIFTTSPHADEFRSFVLEYGSLEADYFQEIDSLRFELSEAHRQIDRLNALLVKKKAKKK